MKKTFNFYLPKELLVALFKLAKQKKVSAASLVREALKKLIDENNQ